MKRHPPPDVIMSWPVIWASAAGGGKSPANRNDHTAKRRANTIRDPAATVERHERPNRRPGDQNRIYRGDRFRCGANPKGGGGKSRREAEEPGTRATALRLRTTATGQQPAP